MAPECTLNFPGKETRPRAWEHPSIVLLTIGERATVIPLRLGCALVDAADVPLIRGVGWYLHATGYVYAWSGSCPCQPFSTAGNRKGGADDRHLWPEMFRLVRECRPVVVFGEQVEGAVKHGWLDGVSADLEGEGYAVGAVVLGAHSVGAPHIRQRLYWVADAGSRELRNTGRGTLGGATRAMQGAARQQRIRPDAGADGNGGLVGVAAGSLAAVVSASRFSDFHSRGVDPGKEEEGQRTLRIDRSSEVGRLGDATSERLQRSTGRELPGAWRGTEGGTAIAPGGSQWALARLIECRDGKARRVPVEPALFPLADGLPGRVGMLRGAGNAIVPQVAAAFIEAYCEVGAREAGAA